MGIRNDQPPNPARFLNNAADNDTPNIYLRPSVLTTDVINKLTGSAGVGTAVFGLNQDKAQKYRGEMLSAYKNINKSSKRVPSSVSSRWLILTEYRCNGRKI